MGYKIELYAEKILEYMVAVAFAIRDSGEKITLSLLYNLCIMNDTIRRYLIDLSIVDDFDKYYHEVNPVSSVLIIAEKKLKNKSILEIDDTLTKIYNKIIFNINEDKRGIYKFLHNKIYLQESNRIKYYIGTYGTGWKYQLLKDKKELVENSYETIYEFIRTEKSIKYMEDMIRYTEGIFKIKKDIRQYVDPTKNILNQIIEKYKKYKIIVNAKKPNMSYFTKIVREQFIEEILRNKTVEVVDIVGQCKNVRYNKNTVKNVVNVQLFITYKSYNIRAYSECFNKHFDPEQLKNYRIRVIGLPTLTNSGRPIIIPFIIMVSDECENL